MPPVYTYPLAAYVPRHEPPPEVLYHYCSAEAFVAIITGPSIRLSALSMSNDTEEGRLLLRLVDILGPLRKDPARMVAALKEHWNEATEGYEGLGFCLSATPDLLGQWRGYAAQGAGVCIGFSTQWLRRFGDIPGDHESFATLEQVEYSELAQLQQFQGTYQALFRAIATGWDTGSDVLRNRHQLQTVLDSKALTWPRKVYTFKNDGFAQEEEWRLLAILGDGPNARRSYRAAGDKIVAYRDLPLRPKDKPIVSVTLGPKHVTPVGKVKDFLRRNFIDAEVLKSRLTYR